LLCSSPQLDISDEFKRVIVALKHHDEKIRVILNKADTIDTQALMRVYGAMMWSLGKVSTAGPQPLPSFFAPPLPGYSCRALPLPHAQLANASRLSPLASRISFPQVKNTPEVTRVFISSFWE